MLEFICFGVEGIIKTMMFRAANLPLHQSLFHVFRLTFLFIFAYLVCDIK